MKIMLIFPNFIKHVESHPELETNAKGYLWGYASIPGLGLPHVAANTSAEHEIIFVDDVTSKTEICERPVYRFSQAIETYEKDKLEFTISLGEPIDREKISKMIKNAGFQLATLVYPGTKLIKSVEIGEGTIVMTPLVGLGSYAKIGQNVILQGYACVGHGTTIGDNCNVSCFTQISGNCVVGKNVFFGIQSVIKEDTRIGDNVIIGMCSPVMRDVPSNHTVFHPMAKMVEHEPGTRALRGNYL